MDIPKKKRRTEEKVDFKKCIICQTDTTEPLVKNVKINHLNAMVTQHSSALWPVPYACAQPYHPGSGSHGQLFHIEFIRAFRRNESDRFCLTAAKIAAIDSALNNSSESDLQVIFRCSKMLHQDILQARSWQFDGTLNSDTSEIIPTKLFTLLQWILSGVATEIQTEMRAEEVNRKAVLHAQQIMYEVKTDRQVKHEPKPNREEKPFRHQREYPLQVGVGILAHQQMRSRSMTDVLHKLGVSVDYTRILRIETQLAQAVPSHSNDNGIYIPPALTKGQFIYFAVDNSDFSEDTPEGKTLVMLQRWPSFRDKQ